ncbi:MAG: hypothetical protein ACT4OP_07530 [Actinomycetota bacterium]
MKGLINFNHRPFLSVSIRIGAFQAVVLVVAGLVGAPFLGYAFLENFVARI